MSTHYHIRPAQPIDQAAIRALERLALEATLPVLEALGLPSPSPPTGQIAETATFVAVDMEGNVVGCISFLVRQMPGAPVPYGYVRTLAVLPGHRRRGVGTQLVQAAAQWARAQGLPALAVHVGEENATALRFFRSIGFLEEEDYLVKFLHLQGP